MLELLDGNESPDLLECWCTCSTAGNVTPSSSRLGYFYIMFVATSPLIHSTLLALSELLISRTDLLILETGMELLMVLTFRLF